MALPNNADQIPPSSILSEAPPTLPTNVVYTSCYCEENVYLLAQTFQKLSVEDKAAFPWDIYVVFISNPHKTVHSCFLSNMQTGK